MTAAVPLALAFILQTVGPALDESQFRRLMAGFYAQTRDISLLFEGGLRFVGPERLLKGKPNGLDKTFQGRYVYRADGSTMLDVYRKRTATSEPMVRKIGVIIKGTAEQLVFAPDVRMRRVRVPRKVPAYPGVFSVPNCPESVILIWQFNDPAFWQREKFEFLGWEEINGAKCLHVRFSFGDPAKGKQMSTHYWIDVGRGGHVLKSENYLGDKLRGRLEKVELMSVDTEDGKQVWLPVAGEVSSHLWGDESFKDPTFLSTYTIVKATIRVNQGLPDSYFNLQARINDTLPGGLPASREVVHDSRPLLRTDPKGTAERLNKALELADQQAAPLKLSAAPSAARSWLPLVQVVFLVLGISLLLGAGVWKLRRR